MSSVTHSIRELTLFGSLGSAKGVTRVSIGFSDLLNGIPATLLDLMMEMLPLAPADQIVAAG
jgi:hypothetical protein